MTAEDLAPFRALLRAQAMAPPRPTLAGRLRGWVGAPREEALVLDGAAAQSHVPPLELTHAAAPPADRLFGRRECEGEPSPALSPAAPVQDGCGPLLLTKMFAPPQTAPAPSAGARVSLRVQEERLAQTPYHPEDVEDARPAPRPARQGPAPGAIAGWSTERPTSAQHRLLSRVLAVVEAEAQGLAARREALAA